MKHFNPYLLVFLLLITGATQAQVINDQINYAVRTGDLYADNDWNIFGSDRIAMLIDVYDYTNFNDWLGAECVPFTVNGSGVGNPEGEFCLEVTNLGVSSLRYTEILNVELFPNPASDQVTLRFGSLQLSKQAQIFIRDLNGRPVWQAAHQGTQMTIPTDHLSAGTYIVELRDAEQMGRRRLIIQ